jgi:Spy/CpxP family protein refolding chaperone
MKKTVYSLIAGAGLLVAGMMNASAETVVVKNVPNGTEVTVVAGPQVESLKQLAQKMDLTKEQKEKIRVILQNADPKFETGMKAAEANSKALMKLCGPMYDEAKIAPLADAQGKLVAEAIKLRLSVRHQVWEVLTPAQREDLKKFRQEMQQQ